MKLKKGFTLIEMLIVLIIILLLLFIVVPNILRTGMSINERAIKTALRAFSAASEAYRTAQKPPAYAESIVELVKPKLMPSYLDNSWNIQPKQGYNLVYAGGGKEHPGTYSLLATPALPRQIAKTKYCVDQKGVVMSSVGDETPLSAAPDGCVGGTVIMD